jgi:predicted CoA-binding protein
MTDVAALLRATKTVLLVDWPSRDVPDALARSGFTVVSNDGPDEYNAYEMDGGEVRVRDVGKRPTRADLVYSHRPIEELPEIVETAKSIGAKAVWVQSGRDDAGAKDPRGCWISREESDRARAIVEAAGLAYVEAPYIGDAARALKVAS